MPAPRKRAVSRGLVGGVGDDAVRKATGRTWSEWGRMLDAAGADTLDHRQIVALVGRNPGVSAWWQQMVTVGYEQARGLRAKHQKSDGYSISRSKTLAVPVARVFSAWKQARQRARWLDADKFVIRKATLNRSLRITWIDGTSSVDVMFYPKGPAKTQVSVQHNKLAGAAAATKMKSFWGAALERLASTLLNAP